MRLVSRISTSACIKNEIVAPHVVMVSVVIDEETRICTSIPLKITLIHLVVNINLLLILFTGIDDSDTNAALARAYNVTPPFRLEDFTYDSDTLLNIIFNHINNTSFAGITVMK